jgi:hypothetical protein
VAAPALDMEMVFVILRDSPFAEIDRLQCAREGLALPGPPPDRLSSRRLSSTTIGPQGGARRSNRIPGAGYNPGTHRMAGGEIRTGLGLDRPVKSQGFVRKDRREPRFDFLRTLHGLRCLACVDPPSRLVGMFPAEALSGCLGGPFLRPAAPGFPRDERQL